ncbi:prepilin peptidase-dependent protein [Dickeya lacustris]
MNNNTRRQNGFSLPELMLVLTVIALLTGSGLYHWQAYRQLLQLEQQARQLLGVLTGIQAQANWRNQTLSLWIKSSAQAWCLVSTESSTDCDNPASVVYYRLHQDVALQESTSPRVVFYGVRNAAQSGHLTLRNPAGKVRLVISGRGRLRLCSEAFSVQGIPLC